LHRNELAGTLHGLTRVRHVTQDDSHIFCTREQIEEEVFGCLDFAAFLYDLFGMEARFELSTRPENKLGSDEEWDFTEGALQAAPSPSGSPRCRCGSCRSGPTTASRRRRSSRSFARPTFASSSTPPTRRSASGSAMPRWRRFRSRSSTATARAS